MNDIINHSNFLHPIAHPISDKEKIKELEDEVARLKSMLLSNDTYKFVNQNPVSVIEIANNGDLLFINKAARQLFNIDDKEYDLKIINFVPHESRFIFFRHVLKTKQHDKLSLNLKKATGQIFWAEIKITHLHLAENQKSTTIWIEDISEQKKTENKLHETKNFYESILNNFPSDIVVFDPQHHYKFINPKAVSNPVMRNWLIGKDDYDYCEHTKKKVTIADTRRALFNKVVESKQQYSKTESLINKQGEKEYHVRNMLPIFNQNKTLQYMVGYGFDITSIKKLEEETTLLNQLLDQSNECVIILDENKNIVFSNSFASNMTGMKNLTGENFLSLDLFETHDIEKSDFLEKAREDKTYKIDGHIQKQGKTSSQIELRASYTESDLGKYYLLFVNDITLRKQAEELLIKGKQIAETAAQDKADFLSIMSHEIRTPLNAVIGLTHLILNDSPKPAHLEKLNILKFSGENLLALVNNILDFNKIDSGNVQLEQIDISLNQLFKGIIYSFQHRADEEGNSLSWHVDQDIPLIVQGDPTRLTQVLNNLVGNALKFTKNGSITISADLVHKTNTSVKINISVHDTGIGIPKEKQKSIFKPFEQASKSTTREYGGTGLGLTITSHLIQLFGSEINIDSEVGIGSNFHFELSLDYQKTQKHISNKQHKNISTLSLKGKKVLLVDDNPINLMIAEQFLINWGIIVVKQDNGKTALEEFLKTPDFDILLIDLQMPIMDGVTVTKEIRKHNQEVPILAFTANQESEVNELITEAGMNGVISKPFNPQKFKKTLIDQLV